MGAGGGSGAGARGGGGSGGGGGGAGVDTICSALVIDGTAADVDTIVSAFKGIDLMKVVVSFSTDSLFFSRSVVRCNLIGVLSHRAFIVIFSGSAFDLSARLFLIIFSMPDAFNVATLFTSSDVDTELDADAIVAELIADKILMGGGTRATDVAAGTGTTTDECC